VRSEALDHAFACTTIANQEHVLTKCFVKPSMLPFAAPETHETMGIPDFQGLMRPLLAYAQDGREKNIGQAINAVADELHISEQDRSTMLPSGRQSVFANRVHWARSFLDKAQAIRRTRRSHFMITERGKALLRDHKERIDNRVLSQFPEFVAFRQGNIKEISEAQNEKSPVVSQITTATPDEIISGAEAILNQTLKSELLERIASLSPTFFEQLVVDLIVAMGYGGSHGAVAERTQRSGDGGIDGIVNEDPLGLDVVYLQAKKYKDDNIVGSPAIQQFAGALVGRGAHKGVFLTTSSFSSAAVQFAERVPQKIVLIDGEKLSQLMIQYGVGVREDRSIVIKKLDLDYFEDIDD
jgi:restriction system protein